MKKDSILKKQIVEYFKNLWFYHIPETRMNNINRFIKTPSPKKKTPKKSTRKSRSKRKSKKLKTESDVKEESKCTPRYKTLCLLWFRLHRSRKIEIDDDSDDEEEDVKDIKTEINSSNDEGESDSNQASDEEEDNEEEEEREVVNLLNNEI